MLGTRPKSAFIIGAAHRIGKTVALALVKDGWAVALHYHHSHEAAFALLDDIVAIGGKGVALQANLTKEEDVLTMIPAAVKALGPLDLCWSITRPCSSRIPP